jgi:3-phosphoshikimate 1-carboxyvinyltransferase
MKKILKPAQRFAGAVTVPSDKSITHRAVLLSSLASGTSTIHNPLEAADCLSTLSCVEALGCNVEKNKNVWKVTGRGLWGYKKPAKPLDCGNSGTTMRLISGILSAQDFDTELFGDASLSKRPMNRVSEPLSSMGAKFDLKDGKYAPFKIHGTKNLKPTAWKSPIASAQVKSSLLLAGLHAKGETSFEEPSLSRDHTERMLKACGVPVERNGFKVSIKGPSELKSMEWFVPGDISSAAFFIVAAILVKNSDIQLKSVNINDTRAGLLYVLERMGAKIDLTNKKDLGGEPIADIVIKGAQKLSAIKIDDVIVPTLIDEVPILAIAATQAEGTTYLRGIGELRVKETDRVAAMAKNLKAMGADVTEEKDGLVIKGPTKLKGAVVSSFDDHRIAMSFAVASLIADGETTIDGADAVGISFPTFWSLLEKLTRG